jgi:fibronectin-binding autotransporter adhesin
MRKSIALALAVVTAGLFASTAARANDASWASGTVTSTGNWTTENFTPSGSAAGWAGPLPDGIGDSGTYDTTGHASTTTTQNTAGSRTVGKLEVTGNTNSSWQVTLASGKNLILNQDGAGPGTAVLSNTMTSAPGSQSNPSLIINGSAGIITLNDDLLITNTSTSGRTGGSIEIDPQFQGTGNITFYSVSNTVGLGHIALFRTGAGASSFAGNSTIAKGAVTFSRGDRFSPSPGNVITIGRSDGAASLIYSAATLGNMENNFATSATAGGTLLFGTNAAATGLVNVKSSSSQTLPHSVFTLNGDLSFTSGGTGTLQIGDPILGAGAVTKIGSGPMRVTNTNTYLGGTIVNAGSLAVGHADAINNGFGFYDATDGTLGSGNVTVNSTATDLEIESGVAAANVIADTKTLSLAGGGAGGTADQGYALLDSGINETVGGLILGGVAQTTSGTYGSSSSGATFQSDEYFSGPGTITLALAPAGLPGDFNNDGKVDAADYATWRKNEVANAALPNDGGAGNQAARFTLWRANFGNPPGAGAGLHNAEVPEPGTLLLALVGVLVPCIGRRRR